MANGRDVFDNEELIQTWVLRYVPIIGEVARTLSPEFRAQHPEIQWSEIIGTRHILVHRYFGIDEDLVWEIVETNLPELKRAVTDLVRAVGSDNCSSSFSMFWYGGATITEAAVRSG